MSSEKYQFTDIATEILSASASLAEQYAHIQILPIHLAVALFDPPSEGSRDREDTYDVTPLLFRQVLEHIHGDPQLVDRTLKKELVRLPTVDPPPEAVSMSPALAKVIRHAAELQRTQQDSFVAIDHLLGAVVQDPRIQSILKDAKLASTKAIEKAIRQIRGRKRIESKASDSGLGRKFKNVEKFTVDRLARAREGRIDPVSGREEELRQLIRVLSRRTNSNAVLIGEPGVGKSSIVDALAQRITASDVPPNLADSQMLSLDVGALLAGDRFQGEFEERLQGILNDIEDSNKTTILFVHELHLASAEAKSGRGIDAAYLFKLLFACGISHCIFATTQNGYRSLWNDATIDRRFQEIRVHEPTVSEAISMLRGMKECYELYHGMSILDSAVVTAVSLAKQHLKRRRLPASAIDLLDEAAADIQLVRATKPASIDNIQRRLEQLGVESRGLQRDRLPESLEQLELVQRESATLKAALESHESRYQSHQEITKARGKLARLKVALETAERANDIQTASDLTYYAIPDITMKIKQLETEDKGADVDGDWNTDTVGAEQIIAVVARQTHIPATQLRHSGEKEKV